MTTRARRIAVVVAVVLAVALVAVPLVRKEMLKREASALVSRYALALAESTEVLDIAPLEGIAGRRQQVRVSNYIMLLEGTGVRLESDLLAQDVLEVRSADETITATVQESWRFVERSIKSGQVAGPETTIDREVEYTLVRDEGGTLRVELALFADDDGAGQ